MQTIPHKYSGIRHSNGWITVLMDGKELPLLPSLAVWNHSPTGFNWGYGGSGPAQLALAIMLQEFGQELAVRLHQTFKWHYVSRWGKEHWAITSEEIQEWYLDLLWQIRGNGTHLLTESEGEQSTADQPPTR